MLNNNNIRDGIMISGYSQFGFRLNNNFMVLGPVVCFSNSIMAWYVNDDRDVSEDSLSLLFHLEPPPSVVVLGVGDDTYRRQVDTVVLAAARKHRCNIVVLPIDAALATYNFIVSEGRQVAGAFIPPRFIPVTDDDVITANARHVHVYGEGVTPDDVWVDDQEHEEKVNANYREFAEVVGAQNAADEELRRKLTPKKDGGEKKIE
jgi:NADH dehydrogenase [ubiquinone] 1 alpha subcomplex assembly factor 3